MTPSDEQPRPAAPVPGPRPSPAAAVAADAVDDGAGGHRGVDAAVASTADLDDRPVAEHVAVFEQAPATLRAALDEVGGGSPTRS